MIWTFSDGTTVELGGTIEGATILAQQLRRDLPRAKVYPRQHPCPATAVSPSDAAMLDLWLSAQLRDRRSAGLRLRLSRPDGIPPLPRQPDDTTDYPADVVF